MIRHKPNPGESLVDFRCRRFQELRQQRREYDRQRAELMKRLYFKAKRK